MVPGDGFAGMSGVESGNDAPLVGGPPGVELHVMEDELPSGEIGEMVPVALPETGLATVPDGVAGTLVVMGGLIVPGAADVDVTVTVGVAGVISPDGGAHVTTVPGVVGSRASGTGASVVSGAPDWVAAENGLGPFKGDDTIAPGVDGRPMAVVPMVETCARQA
jgi:hypothetical protein